MTYYYGILEKSKDEAGAKRAAQFRDMFGGVVAPLLDDRASIMIPPGETYQRPFYRAAVLGPKEAEERFIRSCLTRKDGQDILVMVRQLGFYPVNVDGITLVSCDRPLFGQAPDSMNHNFPPPVQ